jgi:hypothetical protein
MVLGRFDAIIQNAGVYTASGKDLFNVNTCSLPYRKPINLVDEK